MDNKDYVHDVLFIMCLTNQIVLKHVNSSWQQELIIIMLTLAMILYMLLPIELHVGVPSLADLLPHNFHH